MAARILTADAQLANLRALAADDDVKADAPGTLDAAYNIRLAAFNAYGATGEGALAEAELEEANAAIEVRAEDDIPEDDADKNALELRNAAQTAWDTAIGETASALSALNDQLDGADLAALRATVEGFSNADGTGSWDEKNSERLELVEAVIEKEGLLKEAKEARDAAKEACEVAMYDKYRESLEAAMISRANALKEIKALMTTELAKPEPGTAGARCEKALSNGTYRPARGEETCGEGLCCGAARVWMAVGDGVEDAAWRTIETCQAEDTETYMYQPPRGPMETEMPDKISATFTCIEGAKKLAAAASAVAAAVYMLA